MIHHWPACARAGQLRCPMIPPVPSSHMAALPPIYPVAPLSTSLFLRGWQHPNSRPSQDPGPKHEVKDKFKPEFSLGDEVDHAGYRKALQRSCWQGGGWCDTTPMLQYWYLFWDQTKYPEISCEHVQPLSMSTLSRPENRRGTMLKRLFNACFAGEKKPHCFKVQQARGTLSTGIGMLSIGMTMLAGHLKGFMHQFLRSCGGGELLPSQSWGKGTNKPLQNRSICWEQMGGRAVQPQAPAARAGITLIPIYHTPAQ